MKNEKIKEFLTKLAQEEGFKVEFLKLKEKVEKKGFSKKENEKFISESLLPWSKKLGYKLSKKDFIDFDRTQKPTEITGLTTEQLENVSGGGFMLLSLFALFGSALAGMVTGGGAAGNRSTANSDSFSTSLAQYQQVGGDDAASASSDAPSDWTTDRDYLYSAQRFEGTENTSEADFNNPFAGREPIIKDVTELRKILLLGEVDALLRASFDGIAAARHKSFLTWPTSIKNRAIESTSLDDLRRLELELADWKHFYVRPKDVTEPRIVHAGKIFLLRELNALRPSFDELPIDRRDDIRAIFTSLKNRTRESTSFGDLRQLAQELIDLKAVLPEPSAGVPIREDYRLLYDGYEADYGETLG